MSAWDDLKHDIDLNWPDETPNEHYDGVMALLDLHRPAIEAEARRPALDVLRDAGEFGHNMAVPTLGHGGTFDDCPQTLCRRVRSALDAAQEDGA